MRTIGRYELLTQLASGNTGYVFSACLISDPARSADWARRPHGPDDATHAVKLIKPRLAADTRYAQLLRAEAQAATQFRHPNAVRIVEIAQVGTNVFHAFELVRGQTLAAVLHRALADRRFLSPDLTLWIGSCVARALAAAHQTPWIAGEERGMLHGEVSPQSVLVTYDGDVKMLGVGVGRSRLALPPARSRLPYRAPELFERRRPDFTADVYGLGVVLYEALSGTRLFFRDSVHETTQAVLDHAVRPLHHLVPEVGQRVADLIGSMIARQAGDRTRTMAEVEARIGAELSDEDQAYRVALSEQMRALFAEEMVDLPWVEFTPGFLDASAVVHAAQEARQLPGVDALWLAAQESGALTPSGAHMFSAMEISSPGRPAPLTLGAPPGAGDEARLAALRSASLGPPPELTYRVPPPLDAPPDTPAGEEEVDDVVQAIVAASVHREFATGAARLPQGEVLAAPSRMPRSATPQPQRWIPLDNAPVSPPAHGAVAGSARPQDATGPAGRSPRPNDSSPPLVRPRADSVRSSSPPPSFVPDRRAPSEVPDTTHRPVTAAIARAIEGESTEGEVDALVDAIVSASARARDHGHIRPAHGSPPPHSAGHTTPTPPHPANTPPHPASSYVGPASAVSAAPAASGGSATLPPAAISQHGLGPHATPTHPIAPQSTPSHGLPPHATPPGREKAMVVKEAFHSGAIVDVSIDPRTKLRSPLSLPLDEDQGDPQLGSARPRRVLTRSEPPPPGSEPGPSPSLATPSPVSPTLPSPSPAGHRAAGEPSPVSPSPVSPSPVAGQRAAGEPSPVNPSPVMGHRAGGEPSPQPSTPAEARAVAQDADEAAMNSDVSALELRPGDIICERYRVLEKLGSGGMAVVYKVEHTALEKTMALKLLRPELSTIPYVVQRFQREARFVSQLDDPRIVRVTDFGRAGNGSLFIVMELIEGVPLSARLAEGPFKLDLALSIMEQVLLGLEHAHKKNVIHRDLKPDNIMLVERDGVLKVKIVDFGIAKLANDTPMARVNLTQDGMVFGSPRYMSPEQASGDTVDARTDLYAAGVILYEILTGRRPFDGRSARAILSMALTQPPPPMELQLDDPRVARAVEEVVMRTLAKEKEQRYASAVALLEALRAAVSGGGA